MSRFLTIASVLLLVVMACSLGLWQQYQRFLRTPLYIEETGLVINVEAGTNIGSVLANLESLGVTRTDWRWRLLNRLNKVTIKTGEYSIEPGTLPSQLLQLLASGKVVSYRFTIVEGWTVKQLLAALGNNPVLLHTLETVEDLENLPGLPPANTEGWFLPETYVFVRGDSDRQILERAYRDMRKRLSSVWISRDSGLPYESQFELLIMASIIEKETSLESERAQIAGVFVRRLLRHWRLETDPSVIYGMGDSFRGNIGSKDLRKDTPYNTYTQHGLPPTPIALPGAASLSAAAHPADGDAMFFVANGQGGHTFSSTLEAHNRAVRQLIKYNKMNHANQDNKE